MSVVHELANVKRQSFDVVVIGGGPSGMMAATAAARCGARVALVENGGFLGGTATAAMVTQLFAFFHEDQQVVHGLPGEFAERLKTAGGTKGFSDYTMAALTNYPLTLKGLPFDPEIFKSLADEFVLEAGVTPYFHSVGIAVRKTDNRVDGVVIDTVDGPRLLEGFVIDCTGHGTIAARAGAQELESEDLQPMTMCFRLADVDLDRYNATPRDDIQEVVKQGLESGSLFWRGVAFTTLPRQGEITCLFSRIRGKNGANAEDLTEAEILGRQQVHAVVRYMKQNMPGFEASRLVAIAPRIGIRETRRILGEHILDDKDVLRGDIPKDTVAMGAGPMDVHDPKGLTFTSMEMPEGPFGIPLGSLIPKGIDNLLIAGRCISATRDANGAARHMGTCMAIGHGVGVAAAMAADRNADVREVPISAIRGQLIEQSAYVGQ